MVVGPIESSGEGGPGEPQRAEAAGRNERLDRPRPWMERGHVGLEERHAGLCARGSHRLRVGGRRRQWLFAEHVLSGRGGSLHPLPVQAVRQRDVDRVDLGIVEQRRVGAVGARGPEAAAPAVGGAFARHCDEARPGARDDRRQHRLLRDLRGGADHAPADRPRRRQVSPPSITTASPPRVLER